MLWPKISPPPIFRNPCKESTVCKLQEILDVCVKLEMKRKLVRELLVCTEATRIPFSPVFL